MPTEDEIKAFLERFKSNWPPRCYVIPRERNDKGLGILNVTAIQRRDDIMSLSYRHYYRGPEPDRNGSPGEVWFFKKKVNGTDAYIKLKIEEKNERVRAICMSFHQWGYKEE